VDDEIQPNELRDWLTQLYGSGSDLDGRDDVIAKMRSIGSERLFPILAGFLSDPDGEYRCLVSEAIFHIDPQAGVALLLPLLDDPEWGVRVQICGLMHDIGDKRTVQPLIQIMKTDPDPMVRNTAAYALGGIGDPIPIPALIETLDNDHEYDELGYSASSTAATALDNILRTNHTRIKISGTLCTMQPEPLDLELLKAEAMELYRTL
jgi:HEAT repeat protein